MFVSDKLKRFLAPLPSRGWRPTALSAAILGCVQLAGCGTTSLGGNVGTGVEGEGQTVDFSWIPEHPWAGAFQQSGRLRLYAQYRKDGQPVEEDLGVGRMVAARQIRFVLPRSLRAAPDGQVCLFLSGGRSGGAVPVRGAAGGGGDTGRFRFPAWESGVRAASARSAAERDVAELGRLIPDLERQIRTESDALAAQGVRQPEDCAHMRVAPSSGDVAPPDVIAPGNQAGTAQRICIRRARNMRNAEYMANARYRIDAQEAVSQYRPAQGEGGGDVRHRQEEARMFLGHWQKWIGQTGVEYVPEVGEPSEFLPLLGTFITAVGEWNVHRQTYPGTPPPPVVVNGILDAYRGCLEDVGKQLTFKYEAWQKARVSQPARDRIYADRKRAECVGRVEELKRLDERLGVLRGQLTEAQGRVASQPDAAAPSSSRRVLNGETCNI